MKTKNIFSFLFLCFTLLPVITQGCSKKGDNQGEVKIKEPVFAGEFYSASPEKLKNALKFFFSAAIPPSGKKPLALIAPHAGFVFSGQIAADAYNQAKNFKYDDIIILGTNHTTAGFYSISAFSEDEFKTPVGNIALDREAIAALMKEDNDIVVNDNVNKKEHSVEVQVPFIQYAFPGVKIVPLVIGSPNPSMCNDLGKTIAKIFKDKSILIVASSDLSHYPEFSDAVKTDRKTLYSFLTLDDKEIINTLGGFRKSGVASLATCACGEGPVLSAISAAKNLGPCSARLVSYSNSGYSVLGDLDKVVGYGAVAISAGENKEANTDCDSFFNISEGTENKMETIGNETKSRLLSFARSVVEQYLNSDITPLTRNDNHELLLKRGAFVTLKKKGELRGCIGRMDSSLPLYKVVGSMAIEAAFNDHRFASVKPEELKDIEFEISILTPFKKVPDAESIVLETHGVLLKKGGKQAVFLPQVAEETGWSKEKFLDQLCYKAGLRAGDWKDAELYTFTADVFKESDFKSK
jgi:AmmeMemoRadiSam system protein B/AmmeMemoRadiSam system protein A